MKLIHIFQQRLQRNRKRLQGKLDGELEAPVIVKRNKTKTDFYAFEVDFHCPCCNAKAGSVVYSAERPLSCGAVLWVEAEGEVKKTR